MKKPTKEDRKMINNCLSFVVDEVQKRVNNVIEDRSKENIDFLDKDLHAYDCTRELARKANVNSREYDEQINKLRNDLKKYDINL